VDYFGWGTMILTQSLWGFGAALVLFWLMIGTKRFILLVLPLGVLAAILFSSLIVAFMDYSENSIAMTRLLNIADDPSRRARYGSIENIIVDEFLLLGHGVDTSNFQSIGANALAFLVYCFGIAGIALLVVWGVAIQKISATHAILIGFIFTTFPLFSYMYFWVWLGLLLALNKGKAHNSRLSPSISKVPGRSATLINH
jgi:hypothetical protein